MQVPHRQQVIALTLAAIAFMGSGACAIRAADPDRADTEEAWIRPYEKNPRYWQYKGRPVVLLGGSQDDNLFQIPNLKEHLDEIQSVGGNYIRNTMSARPDFGFEVQEFKRLPDGKYDLGQWNDEYWTRFHNLLKWCHERDIIIQIEIWDRFDYSRNHWQTSPWNPANNVNYTYEQTGFAKDYPEHPSRNRQPFFFTIPGMSLYTPKLDVVREYQERRVAKMLSYSLKYPNVLYCMNNETSGAPEWGQHWMKFIRTHAAEQGVEVYATDMFDDVYRARESTKLRLAIDNPEMYPFLDISQNNSRNYDEDHWKNILWIARELKAAPRPMNNTKIYEDVSKPSKY